MHRALIIGYGNLDRTDDGVAYSVVNALRRRLQYKPLSVSETGMERLGEQPDSIFVRQLVPELLETAAGYGQIIFVDAHVYEDKRELFCSSVLPEYVPSPFTHHLTPSTFLALVKALYGQEPAGYLASIRGYDFDFRRGLSKRTKALVAPAVEGILDLL